MGTLVIKNLPDHLHARLKQRAQRNHRSVTKEAVSLIETGLTGATPPIDLPPPIRLRSGFRPTIQDIEAGIAEGQE